MTPRTMLSFGLSALVLGAASFGLPGNGSFTASAGARAADPAADAARRAGKAVAKRDPAAVTLAETAVASGPTRAEYRLLLGQSYLQAGRFQSARDAFADALRLAPEDGRAALNLSLAQIATGDWGAARRTLDAHGDRMSASDRGLAIALAGDPATAVALLMQAARAPGADAKLRQNLGLALALSGQWSMARAVAAADLSPADVDGRMQEWAAFAQPRTASDQVAALLGVRAAADSGQPIALALNAPVPVAAAPVATPVTMVPEPAVVPVAATKPTLLTGGITFAERREVVQALLVVAAPLIKVHGPAKVAVATPLSSRRPVLAPRRSVAPAAGPWFVQLGAFENAAVARDAWSRISRRHAGFAGQLPQGAAFRSAAGMVYRLSIGGFDLAGAEGMCRKVRAKGGVCFVRRAAGDQVAQWVRSGVQLASR